MIKQLILPLVGVAAFIILVGTFVKNPSKLGIKAIPTVSPKATEQEVKIGNISLKVKVASTPEKRAKGLSGVGSLSENSGMLFVFDTGDVSPTFWMKDMKISLDMIWINDGKIVQIDKNIEAPIPNTPDPKLKLFRPQSKVDYVLEVNGGFSDRNNIEVGDSITI